MHSCPLCGSETAPSFKEKDPLGRELYRCNECYLLFVDNKNFLELSEQKKRYDFHENTPSEGYIQFLKKCILPSLEYLREGNFGLDYGSGPVPEFKNTAQSMPNRISEHSFEKRYISVLADILEKEYSMYMDCYDPIYNPIFGSVFEIENHTKKDENPIQKQSQKSNKKEITRLYDFIFSTEVWEHFRDPRCSLLEINNLLKPKGTVSVMTTPWSESLNFSKWHYAKDDTHIVFYHEKTMEWIAEFLGWKILKRPHSTVWIFQKSTV